MLYNEEIKNSIISELQNKAISLACNAINLSELGFHQSENFMALQATQMLLNAYENVDVFSQKQQDEIDYLYNTIRRL